MDKNRIKEAVEREYGPWHYTVFEVADHARVSVYTVKRWAREGHIQIAGKVSLGGNDGYTSSVFDFKNLTAAIKFAGEPRPGRSREKWQIQK